jgi:hypothetical protein
MLQTMKRLFRSTFANAVAFVMVASLSVFGTPPAYAAEEAGQAGESAQILQAFNQQHKEAEHAKAITDKDKQRIMFMLGVLLFTLVLITGGLGLAMGLYGKQVFVAHMVFAGLSMTLAVVHAIVGLVWFYPF